VLTLFWFWSVASVVLLIVFAVAERRRD